MLQLHPGPVAAVGVSFAGTTSVIVTVPDVVASPEFVAVIRYSASVWPCLKLPLCVLEIVRSDTAVTVVLADPQLEVVHEAPGAAGDAPPDGSTDAKFVIVPGLEGAVALIVNEAVPMGLAAGIPLDIVAVHVRSAPGVDGRTPQLTVDTRVPAVTDVATTPAGS